MMFRAAIMSLPISTLPPLGKNRHPPRRILLFPTETYDPCRHPTSSRATPESFPSRTVLPAPLKPMRTARAERSAGTASQMILLPPGVV